MMARFDIALDDGVGMGHTVRLSVKLQYRNGRQS